MYIFIFYFSFTLSFLLFIICNHYSDLACVWNNLYFFSLKIIKFWMNYNLPISSLELYFKEQLHIFSYPLSLVMFRYDCNNNVVANSIYLYIFLNTCLYMHGSEWFFSFVVINCKPWIHQFVKHFLVCYLPSFA